MPRHSSRHHSSQEGSSQSQRSRGEHSRSSRHSQRHNDSISDDEGSHSQTSRKGISRAELDTMANSVILYILRANEEKHNILKANIQKNVLFKVKEYSEIMTEVKARFKKVFGYNLWEYENGKYILTNNIPNNIPHVTLSDTEKRKKLLLFLILTHIFMCEDACLEDNLWAFLTELGITVNEHEQDQYFGSVRQIIHDEFIQQKYVEKIKRGNAEVEYFEYSWGVRAEHELSLRQVMEFVEKVYNIPMSSFKKQHTAMLQRERLDAQRN